MFYIQKLDLLDITHKYFQGGEKTKTFNRYENYRAKPILKLFESMRI